VRFTEANVRTYEHPDDKANYTLWDENLPGFGFRVQAGGKKVYYAKYRMGTKQRWFKIGPTDQISFSAATKQAKSIFESVANGIDPANTKAKATAAAAQTFGSAINGYLEQLQTDRCSASHVSRIKSYLEKYFQPLHTISLASIDRATVSRELNVIKKRGPIAANRARSALSAYFNWSIANGFCESNPVDKSIKNRERSRQRVLSSDELKILWTNLPDNEYGKIVKLLALTAQRKNEIANLERSEINWVKNQIELPGRRTKNGLAHIVPLSPPAVAILKSVGGDGKCVFKQRNNWQFDKDALGDLIQIPHWVLHDLRRTGKTNLSKVCKIPPHVSEAVLNHKPRGLEGVYNLDEYLDEKRVALNKYAEYILSIVQ
jgi:integrase